MQCERSDAGAGFMIDRIRVIRELVSTVEAQEKLIDGFFEKNGDTVIGEVCVWESVCVY